MIASIQIELDHTRKRLDYYRQLSEKSQASKKSSINKWIEIYDERVQKLTRQLARAQKQAADDAAAAAAAAANAALAPALGLKTQLKSAPSSKAKSSSSKRA